MNKMSLYMPLVLWALHQALGTDRGNRAYAVLATFISSNP